MKRDQALEAFVEAREHASLPELIDGGRRYAELLDSAKPPAPMSPANWLLHHRWLDEPFVPAARSRRRSPQEHLIDGALQRIALHRRAADLGLSRDEAESFVHEAIWRASREDPDAAARPDRPRSPHQTMVNASRRVAAELRRQMELSGEFGADPGAGAGLAAAVSGSA